MFKNKNLTIWHILLILISGIFLIPLLFIGSSVLLGISDNFYHLYENLLFEYSLNSLYLVLGVSLLVTFIGVTTAWLVTFYNFYGKKIFQWALILPLAVPPYLLAYVFTEFFDYSGTANNLIRNLSFVNTDGPFFPNIRTIFGAILVFSFTLYPYVYMVSRVAFMNIPASIIESSMLLGKNSISTFINLSVPIIRPAIIAGVALVAMETLADFGAVQHFAIPTFTTGIFRTWTGLYDLTTALQLSTLLLIVIFFFLVVEKQSRRRIRYVNAQTSNDAFKEVKLKGFKKYFASLLCFLPVFFGFILPVFELISWSTQVETFISPKTVVAASNTIIVSTSAAIVTCFLALLVNFIIRTSAITNTFSEVLSVGYAVPGLILAVGITKMLTSLDNLLVHIDIFVTGSLLGLLLAYIIKSYAISNNVLNASYNDIPESLDDSAQTLGKSKREILANVHLPLLKTGLLTAFLLVLAELIKELPATLILRPFNFDTLSVSVFLLASEERMFEAAFPSLVIIIFGLVPIYFLNKLILHNNR